MNINILRQKKPSAFLMLYAFVFLFYATAPFYQGALAYNNPNYSAVACPLNDVQQTVFIEFDHLNTVSYFLKCPTSIVTQSLLPRIEISLFITRFTRSEVGKLTKALLIHYGRTYINAKAKSFSIQKSEKHPKELENDYLIHRTASIILVKPNAKIHVVFSTPHEPDTMISDLAAIHSAWQV